MDQILFFDGDCAMCNALVNFIIAHDKKKLFKFAPLQGSTAEELVPENQRSDLHTALFLDEKGLHQKSEAIVNILAKLGGFFSLIRLAKIVPRAIRDRIYDYVAKNRYSWFGQNDRCIPMSKEDKLRLLP